MIHRFFYKLMMGLVLTYQVIANDSGTSKEGFAPIEQGSLYYKLMGQGAPIVILHGGPGLTHNHFLPQMTPLAQNHTLVVYDQRGSGRSSHSSIDKKYLTIQQFTADLDALRKHLRLDKITVIGHSWGSFLAIFYALNYPQHTDKLVLMGPQPMCFKGMLEFEATFNQRLSSLKEPLSVDQVHSSTPSTPENLIELYRRLSAAFCYDPAKAQDLTLHYDPVADQRGRLVANHLNSTLFSDQWDYHSKLSQLMIPTLIVHGLQDPVPLWTVQKLHQNIAKSTLVIIDHCGHFPYIEQSEEFFKVVHTFLDSHSKDKT